MPMKHGIWILTATLILALSLPLGVCGCKRKNFPKRGELEPKVMTYMMNKYGFEPEIIDWRTETNFNTCNHYLLVNDGTDQFEIHIDTNSYITDDYESAAINEDMRKWADGILPGTVYAYADHEFYGETQKYSGDVWEFMEEYSVYPALTFTYVGQDLDTADAEALMDAIAELDVTNEYTLISCPSDEDAATVRDQSFVNGYIDIVRYAPYIDESLSYHSPDYEYRHDVYDLRQTGDVLYCELVPNGDTPVPASEYGVREAGSSLSDICPTYEITNNYYGSGDSSDDMDVLVFVPLSLINEEIVYQNYYGSNTPDNLVGVESSSLDGDPTNFGFRIYGDYVVLDMYTPVGTTYFSVERDS